MFAASFNDTSIPPEPPYPFLDFERKSLPSARSLLEYVVNHVFFPVDHPEQDDSTTDNAHALVCAVHAAACAYNEHIEEEHQSLWPRITKMLENLRDHGYHPEVMQESTIVLQLGEMQTGDILILPASDYDSPFGIMLQKEDDGTLFESIVLFSQVVGSSAELAIEISNEVFDDEDFQYQFASFFTTHHRERRGEPLYNMLREAGRPVEHRCVAKRADPVRIRNTKPRDRHAFRRSDDEAQWSRSSLWFLVKATIHTFLDRSPLGRGAYKVFILFFMCNLANHALDINLPNLLLHSMSTKILRRFRKFGSSFPQWLYDMVLDTCTRISQILDQRWQEAKCVQRLSPAWDLSKLDLSKDTQPSLPRIHKYISNSLANRVSDSPQTIFHPSGHLRGTLNDFLSDPKIRPDEVQITLFDVQRAVAENIDDWVAHVTNVDEACEQLERLMCQYQSRTPDADRPRRYSFGSDQMSTPSDPPDPVFPSDPDHSSFMILMIVELWIAFDKLLINQVPILADYSPEVPIDLLSKLLLHDAISIHRLCRAYQYLLARHNRARRGWSVFSDQFTEDSFSCRYYDSSPHLQRLKAHIGDALPSDPLHAKVVVFELQCPASFDKWRSVTCWISPVGPRSKPDEGDTRVNDISALQSYVRSQGSLSLYANSAPRHWDRMYYVYEGPSLDGFTRVYTLGGSYGRSQLQQYLDDTKHTSNEVLATQADRDPNLSLDEFIAFAHLRSGGSLQWFNILRELRTRTLDLRREEIYLLFAQASAQVGPPGSTGELLWHQEIEDASFCFALLDELESLFNDVGVGSLDGPAMAIISLLAGVLASKSSKDTSERAIQLLRSVRRKTFDWVHELLYSVRTFPTNENLELLRDTAAVCRSTFDVGSAMISKLFHSPQDIETALSCSMVIHATVHALPTTTTSNDLVYSTVLLNRDARLSLILEDGLRDAIQADPTDLGIDRAVQMVWPCYRPSLQGWEVLPLPNSQWLVSEALPTGDRRPTQLVHINLLDGSVLVDGKPVWNKLPKDVTDHPTYNDLFGKVCDITVTDMARVAQHLFQRDLMVVASDLPEMDFVTASAMYDHYVYFAIRKNNWSTRVIICAKSEATDDLFELIPWTKLQADLPNPLVDAHVHWLNLSTSIIEIRPIGMLWEQTSDNWTIHCRPGESRVTKGGEFLVDKQSPTWEMVSSRFRGLDDPENIIITVAPADTTRSSSSLQLSIALPRFGLSFFVNEVGNVESRDFKDMVFDEDQDIGTLFGLVNRLILCPKAQTQIEVDLVPKCILIPQSQEFSQQLGRHRSVASTGNPSSSAHYYTYEVDSELGCLKGFADVESRLHLAYQHAFTGRGCRPDPLTGRTGVEEAISLVWLAGARQVGYGRDFQSSSPQICFAFEKLAGGSDLHKSGISSPMMSPEFGLPRHSDSNDALLREACLFPSEVASDVQFSRTGPLALLNQLLQERSVPILPERTMLPRYNSGHHNFSQSPNIDPLRQLFSSLRVNETAPRLQNQYISRLHNSTHHFHTTDPINATNYRSSGGKPSTERLRKHYVQCRAGYRESLDILKTALGPKTEFERVLDQCGQWPRITPFVLFRCLASTSPIELPENWKACLVSLALLALDLQRARRLLRCALDNLEDEFYREFENEGCDGWDAARYPDWLLIQLQGNFLIRRVQADIAMEMMSPRSGKNTVMQVHMGEGKTSVIIPICAAALADGNRLVRVIVPRALIPQTLRILTDRLGGLIDMPIFHLSFSRQDMGYSYPSGRREPAYKAESLHELIRKCREDRGIIIMEPEHVLSLKLACVETQLLKDEVGTKHTPVARERDFKPEYGNGIGSIPVVPKWGFERVLGLLTGSLLDSLPPSTHVSFLIQKVSQNNQRSETPEESIRNESAAKEPTEPIDDDDAEITRSMQAKALKLQAFLETHSRDVIDESDDVLRSQFQLIYAIGQQQPFEGSPDRWLIVQQVLGLVKRHAYLLSTHDSHIIRCDVSSPGSFPHIHILQEEGGEQLVSLIVQDVLDGRLSNLSLHSELGLTGAIWEFLLRKNVHPDTVRVMENYARQSTTWDSLLLLRGLLAHKILLFALTQRRWRVDYGLDWNYYRRTMLAIPFRAKDVPSERAEFGHPDITILLTCLSYYYGGLSDEQLSYSFELLLKQDDPSSEYALWLEDCDTASVPNDLKKLSGVNIRSLEQWNDYLIPLFTYNKRAIDMYLSQVVFPTYAEEFPHRISGSSWDIAEQKNHLVTGFSGTSDGQYLLPTSISQDDPDHLHQTSTNAKVLAYLLQPENSAYLVTADENGERWTTLKLLSMVVSQDPRIRVLLDVGAQILDLSNEELAKAWLDCTLATDVAGAIFFGFNDELMVLARDGTTQALSSSPLVRQLHRCVAYLDDSHTRGTDLKFPRGFRAAVTLGNRVTKDRLVQGCMRMRKLGHGHSVMFFAPPEVDRRIRGLVAKESQDFHIQVTTADILRWTIHETWSDIQRQAPYWAQQGMSHQSRHEAWTRFCREEATVKELADAWVQPELKSLADMYMPYHSQGTTSSMHLPREIRDRCANLGSLSLPDVWMDEEQEREVSREMEREREVRRQVPDVLPAKHNLHPDVTRFVRTGVIPLPSKSKAFRHVFATDVTAIPGEPQTWSPYILATADFCETIVEDPSIQLEMNDFLRPVQWVVSGKMCGRDALVLVSPFEADRLMPEIRISKHVHLHLYIPRTTKRMKPSDDLRLYSVPPLPPDWIPPWNLINQLNVFAGQLYLSDFTSYFRLCRFLGVYTEDLPQKADTMVVRNWFSNPDSSDEEIRNRFEGTPLPLAMQLLFIRRGTDFSGTHMGRILDGWPLTEDDLGGVPESMMEISLFDQELVFIEPGPISDEESTTTEEDFHSARCDSL